MLLNNQILQKIHDYIELCSDKYQYHLNASVSFKRLYIYTTTPIIIFSSITTVLASLNGVNVDPRIAIAVFIFSGLTTIGQALAAFFEYNTSYSKHFDISNKYVNLSRMIESELYINYYSITDADTSNSDDNKAYVKYLFDKILVEFTNIQNNEIYIPMSSTQAIITPVQMLSLRPIIASTDASVTIKIPKAAVIANTSTGVPEPTSLL